MLSKGLSRIFSNTTVQKHQFFGAQPSSQFNSQSCPTLCGPWTVVWQAPLSLEFPMQEYWSGLPLPEHQRIDAFELWYWRRFLRVPWTARRSNQFILKEISPEYSLEGLMLKLKLQYFGHLMQTVDSFEKTLTLGRIKSGRRR